MSRENDLYRRITELIAELHALYHAGFVSKFRHTVVEGGSVLYRSGCAEECLDVGRKPVRDSSRNAPYSRAR